MDSPGRLCFFPVRHCLIRYNEIRGAFKGSWTNAEEIYLIHGIYENYFGGDYRRTVGRVSSADDKSLSDYTRERRPDLHADCVVLIISGRGFGQYRWVTGNTKHTLAIETPWLVRPDETSRYVLGRMYFENDLFANVNDTPMRMSLWNDCIATVVDRHRDEFSKGIDICATADDFKRKSLHPSWYNMIINGWLDGAMVRLFASDGYNAEGDLLMFGNYVAGNKIRQAHMYRTGTEKKALFTGAIHASGDQSHGVISQNQISFTDAGIVLGERARKTFVEGNTFQNVPKPILNNGMDSVIRENKQVRLSAKGLVESPYSSPSG